MADPPAGAIGFGVCPGGVDPYDYFGRHDFCLRAAELAAWKDWFSGFDWRAFAGREVIWYGDASRVA